MQGQHFRAIDEHGRVHLGFTSNKNHIELAQQLQQRGWQQLPVSGLQRAGNFLGFGPRLPRWSYTAASIFTLHLSQLLVAGVPLLQALDELIKMENHRSVRIALREVKNRIDQGSSLSDAVAGCPGLFGPDFIASVRAGESSGQLSGCLRQQSANLQWQAELSERLKTVLAYPLFALVCLVIVFLFVLLYLVPAMLPLLSMSSAPLPTHTKWLLSLSELIRQSGVVVLMVIFIVSAVGYGLLRSSSVLEFHLQSLVSRSVYGQIQTHFSLARYARSTSLLYESGVEFTDAMQISQNLVRSAHLRTQLDAACQQILAGESIANAMQSQLGLPRLFVRMVSAGEKAGVMDVALRQCADQLQSTAQYSLARAERLIGPTLLCVMGGLLLWVALSVLGPIYSAVGQAGVLS